MKKDLRQSMRATRRALSPAEQSLAAQRLLENISTMHLFRVCRRVACYIAHDGEIDPRLVIERLWSMGRKIYLPVLSRLTHDRLWFAEVSPETSFRPNRYGIPEPETTSSELVRAQALDLLLVPLVAFDATGNRLGMGGGFYDKSLAFLNHRQHLRKPHLLGLAHDFQRVPTLPADRWDIPLHGIVSDAGVYSTRF